MMAFYNGGEGAGASQTWRHLQCIEVPSMEGAPIEEWVEDLEVERKGQSQTHSKLFSAGTHHIRYQHRRQTFCQLLIASFAYHAPPPTCPNDPLDLD